MADIIKRLSVLLSVKSLVTIILCWVFAYLSITGVIAGTDFMTIFLVVISFYFGGQSQKLQDALDAKSEEVE